MAKPIFIVKIPTHFNMPNDKVDVIREKLRHALKDEYHVLVMAGNNDTTDTKFECLNDCTGLPDVDIAKLLVEFNSYNTQSYSCRLCGKSFVDEHALEAHMHFHH